jgi:methyl-accepting chemotaxis protein
MMNSSLALQSNSVEIEPECEHSPRSHDTLREAISVCKSASSGDLEPRILDIPETGQMADLANSINHLLDTTDAFIRESAATLKAASEKRYYRAMIERGMPGSFRRGTTLINEARNEMARQQNSVEANKYVRAKICHDLRRVVGESTEKINKVLVEITRIMKTTHILALNASIEAARAGEAGRGFEIVAKEVKVLASRIESAIEDIAHEVASSNDETNKVLNDIAAST